MGGECESINVQLNAAECSLNFCTAAIFLSSVMGLMVLLQIVPLSRADWLAGNCCPNARGQRAVCLMMCVLHLVLNHGGLHFAQH